MTGNRICAFALATPFAILCCVGPANAFPFDGNWKWSLVTTDGQCGIIKVGLAARG